MKNATLTAPPTQKAPKIMCIRRRMTICKFALTLLTPVWIYSTPVGDKEVRLARLMCVTIRCPHQFFPVGAEFRKSIEGFIECQLLESGPIGVDEKKIEVSAPRAQVVRCENDFLPIWSPRRAEIRAAQVRDLVLIRSVSVHQEELDLRRSH